MSPPADGQLCDDVEDAASVAYVLEHRLPNHAAEAAAVCCKHGLPSRVRLLADGKDIECAFIFGPASASASAEGGAGGRGKAVTAMPEYAEEVLTNAEALRGAVALVSSVQHRTYQQSLTVQAERVAAVGAVAMVVVGNDRVDVPLLLCGEGTIPAVAVSGEDFGKLRAKVVVLEVGSSPEPEPERSM